MATEAVVAAGPSSAAERVHALDAVRAGALLLGVAFHAAIIFVPGDIGPVQDRQSLALTLFAGIAHTFRMPLFFLVAGFFGRMMLERRGARGFAGDRARRITLPLIVFLPLTSAAAIGAHQWGARASGHAAPALPAMGVFTLPLTHLWFLYYLTLFYAATLALRACAGLVDREGRLGSRVVDPILRVSVSWLIAAPVAALPLILAFTRAGNWGAQVGVPTPDTGLVPRLIPLSAYAAAFAFGWLLQRQPELLGLLRRQWAAHLAAAVGLSATLMLVILSGAGAPSPNLLHRGAQAALYALTAWTWTLGLLGASLRFLAAERAGVRYVADASYWIYIAHLPLVLGLQVALFHLPWPALAKYAVILGAALPALFASYAILVRYTWLGSWLNGRRVRPPAPGKRRASAVNA